MAERLKVAVVGASGYAGGEFLRLALAHPRLEVAQIASEDLAGSPVHRAHPNLRSVLKLNFISQDALSEADLLVLALPYGEAARRYDHLAKLAPRLLDLSADFRLEDTRPYEKRYGEPHPRPDLLGEFVYGSPELHREALRGARRIAGPGPLATAVLLAIHPLLKSAVPASGGILVEAKLGSSAATDDALALGELEQELPGSVSIRLKTTALSRVRGVLATAYLRLPDGYSDRDVLGAYRERYQDEPFVRLVGARRGLEEHDLAILEGTNYCDIGFELDPDSGRLVVTSALDNLVKGGAGNALQALNVSMGWPEGWGLEFFGLHP